MGVVEEALQTGIFSSQIAMIIIACTLVPFLVYLIYRYGIKEKSFEEVLEEQKKRSLEEEMKQKAEKSKKEKKFKRGFAKKKEKAEAESPAEEKIEIPQIEVIEPVEAKPQKKSKKTNSSPNQISEQAAEKKKVKAAAEKETEKLQGRKKESEKVQEKKKELEKLQEQKEPEKLPEKKKELAKDAEKPKVPPQQSKPAVEKSKAVAKAAEVKTKQEVEKAVLVQSEAVSGTVSKKKKKEPVEKDAAHNLTASKLLSLIKEIALDTDEIQNLIDILLNKQKDAAAWKKHNDPHADTKRNLLEKEQQLDIELKQNQAIVLKLNSLREEHNTLRAKYTNLEKSSQEKIKSHQQEIGLFSARLKQLQEQCAAEREKNAQVGLHADQKLAVSVKSLEEEKTKLQQKLAKLESEFRGGVPQAEYDALKKSREDLQKVHALLVDQHTQLVSSHRPDQSAELKRRLEESTAKQTSLAKEAVLAAAG